MKRLLIASNIFLIFVIVFTNQTSEVVVKYQAKVEKPVWDTAFIKSYTLKYIVKKYPNWQFSEFAALEKLWQAESKWNPKADNKSSSAYGIAQVLKTKHNTPAPQQVERGLAYIVHRYQLPSKAWQFHQIHNWY